MRFLRYRKLALYARARFRVGFRRRLRAERRPVSLVTVVPQEASREQLEQLGVIPAEQRFKRPRRTKDVSVYFGWLEVRWTPGAR